MKRKTKNIIAIFLLCLSVSSIGGMMYYIYTKNQPKKQGGTPPSIAQKMPSNNTLQGMEQNGSQSQPKQMKTSQSLAIYYYLAMGMESFVGVGSVFYLIVSKGSKRKVSEAMKTWQTKAIGISLLAVVTGGFTFSEAYIANHYLIQAKSMQAPGNGSSQNGMPSGQAPSSKSSSTTKASGKTTVTGTKTITGSQTSSKRDQNAILVKKGATATIKNATVKKTGASSNTEASDFSGVNAAILAQNGSANITNTTITTSARGANAVFATGSKAKIYMSHSTIKTTGSASSRGLDATYGGTIIGKNLTISTTGGSCATLATDRGEGTVKVTSSQLTTKGAGSPLIYSTGNISVTKTTGTAYGAQIVVVEGKNQATVNNATLSASGKGNRDRIDQAGVMLYQSMSGDAKSGVATFTANNSNLSILKSSAYYKSAPMFFVTNTEAVINLNNTKLNFGSGTLLSVKGTSAWGTSGQNGGHVTLNAKNQTLTGHITADSISTVSIKLTNSTYKGAIDTKNKAKKVTLTLDKSSKITLTGDTHVTSLKDADTTYSNINFNGYKLYVNGKAIN